MSRTSDGMDSGSQRRHFPETSPPPLDLHVQDCILLKTPCHQHVQTDGPIHLDIDELVCDDQSDVDDVRRHSRNLEKISDTAMAYLTAGLRLVTMRVQKLLDPPLGYHPTLTECQRHFYFDFSLKWDCHQFELDVYDEDFDSDPRQLCLASMMALFGFQVAASEFFLEPTLPLVFLPSCDDELECCSPIIKENLSMLSLYVADNCSGRAVEFEASLHDYYLSMG